MEAKLSREVLIGILEEWMPVTAAMQQYSGATTPKTAPTAFFAPAAAKP